MLSLLRLSQFYKVRCLVDCVPVAICRINERHYFTYTQPHNIRLSHSLYSSEDCGTEGRGAVYDRNEQIVTSALNILLVS